MTEIPKQYSNMAILMTLVVGQQPNSTRKLEPTLHAVHYTHWLQSACAALAARSFIYGIDVVDAGGSYR